MEEKLVSIIMPAFNEADYIGEAIKSVLNQNYFNLELLIVNNGSTDNTKEIIKSFNDSRIKYFEKDKNYGVSIARNTALNEMQGNYFFFLDADDVLPPNAIKPRAEVLNLNSDVYFVSGTIHQRDKKMEKDLQINKTEIQGNPFYELITLSPKAHTSSSWLRRRIKNIDYHFKEGMAVFEDLLFSVTYSRIGLLKNIDQPVLYYRRGHVQTTSFIKGFEDGYFDYYNEIKTFTDISKKIKLLVKFKIIKIMVFSYLKMIKPFDAIKVFFRYIFI